MTTVPAPSQPASGRRLWSPAQSARERGTNAVTASSARAYNVRLLSIVDALHNGVGAKRRNDGFDRI